jgi:hypothetical protein
MKSKDFPVKNWIVGFLLFMLNGMIYGFVVWLLISSTQPGAAGFNLNIWLSISEVYNLAWLIGFIIIFVPSGLGLRELTLSYLLATQMGIGMERATFISVLMRLLMAGTELLFVGIGFLSKGFGFGSLLRSRLLFNSRA